MNYDNMNMTAVSVDMQAPTRTIKDNVDETAKVMTETMDAIDRIIAFMWAENTKHPDTGIEVKSLDTAIVSNLEAARMIWNAVCTIANRIGA